MKVMFGFAIFSLMLIRSQREMAGNVVTVETLKQFAAFNAHDLDAVMSFFGDDCELLMHRGSDLGDSDTLARLTFGRD